MEALQGPFFADIFATKDIEYVLVIGFLAALVVFWRLLNRAPKTGSTGAPSRPRSLAQWFRHPADRYYHQGHSWAMPEEDGLVKVGIDDFAQMLLGRPTAVALPPIGTHVRQGAPAFGLAIETQGVDLLCPVGGEVVAHNPEVLKTPHLMNSDPYGEGWLMKVRPSQLRRYSSNLLSGTLADAWVRETSTALQRRLLASSGMLLQDGGELVEGFGRHLGGDHWDEMVAEFLLTRPRSGSSDAPEA